MNSEKFMNFMKYSLCYTMLTMGLKWPFKYVYRTLLKRILSVRRPPEGLAWAACDNKQKHHRKKRKKPKNRNLEPQH